MTDSLRQSLPEDVRKELEEAEKLRMRAAGAVQHALVNTDIRLRQEYVERAHQLVSEASLKWCLAVDRATRVLQELPLHPVRVVLDETGNFKLLDDMEPPSGNSSP